MKILYLGGIFVVVLIVGNSIICVIGNIFVFSVVMIVVGIVNFVLDLILIFGVGLILGMGL